MATDVIFYGSIFIVSILLSCIYVLLWHKHFSVHFSIIYVLIPIVNLGFLFRAYSQTLEEYIVGLKISYLGGCFLISFITLYIYDMCRIRLPKLLILAMFGWDVVMYLMVLTIGRGKIFYRSISADTVVDRLVVHKIYGPMHTVFYLTLIAYLIMGLGAIVYSIVGKRDVSRRILWLLFIPELVCMVSFFGGKLISPDLELAPVGYVFAQAMYLLVAHFVCLYDVEDMAIDSLSGTGETGFISFDLHFNYLGCNDSASEVFSELREITVDESLRTNRVLYEQFRPWIDSFCEDETKDKYYYAKADKIYLVDVNHLFHNGAKAGYQLVISDDTKNQQYIALLDRYNSDLEKEVERKTEDLVRMHNNLIRSMAKLVESRDNSTGGHIIRTSDVVEILLDEIKKDAAFVAENGITEEFCKNLIKAAPLHDIGKIAVDDEILRKPGRFTEEEFEQMKAHAPEGAKVLHSILTGTDDESFRVLAENVAHYHHERMDGSGYPEGLSGEEIPLEARIMAIADVYDALVSKRVYKESMPFDKADAIMMDSMGRHFDKRLERFYVAARPRMESYYEEERK